MHRHQLRSQIPQVFQVTSHIAGVFTLYFVSSIQFVAVPIYSISDLYANSLYSFTLRKRSCEVLSFCTGHTCASSSATASMVRQVSFDSAELLDHSPNTKTQSTVAPIDLIPTAEICLSQQILAEMSSPTPPDWLTQKPETLTRRHRPPCKI